MALFECEECGQMVSDKAEACPKCGCPIEKKNVCEECGERFRVYEKVCPKCGCPVPEKQFRYENRSINNLTSYSDFDTGMFKDPFSFDGRIRRLEYGLSFIFQSFYALFIWAVFIKVPILILLLALPCLWFYCAQACKRCHDLGCSGWYQLIPFYWFILLFCEGDKYPNIYGNCPK